MRKRNRRSVTGLVGLTLAALVALPTATFANTSAPIARTGGMTAVLPLLGSGLTVEVTLDVVGNITNVNLDPVTLDPGGDLSANRVGPHAVSFETADGTVQVKIQAKGDKLSLKAAASSLESLIGPGTWTADVFGTGEMTDVGYTIGANEDGSPTLAIDSVSAPAGVTVDQGPVEAKSHKGVSSASARISFSLDGFVKRLTVRVSVRNEGDHPASLKIELSGKDRQKLNGSLESLLGEHAWSGFLCDGTAVQVNFVVNEDGTATFVSATAPATAKETKHGIRVRLDGTRTKVNVKLVQGEDENWTLRVDAKTDKCRNEPAVAPSVNTPVVEGAESSDHHGDADKRDEGDRGGDRHGDSDKRDGGDRGGDRHGDSDRQGDSGRQGDSDRHGDGNRGDGNSEGH